MTQEHPPAGRIVYIGSDGGHRNIISSWLESHYPEEKFEFLSYTLSKEGLHYDLFNQLLYLSPDIIYFDFTENSSSAPFFAQTLKRDNSFSSTILVGLLEKKEEIHSYREVGADFIFLKGGEIHDVLYGPMGLSFPNIVKRPSFARAKLNKRVDLINDLQILYITSDYLHAESNLSFENEQKIKIGMRIPQENISGHTYKVKSTSTSNLFYNFEYAHDLEFIFAQRPDLEKEKYTRALKEESDERKKIKFLKNTKISLKSKIQKYKKENQISKEQHKQWLSTLPSIKKKTKVLVVDKKMEVLKNNNLNSINELSFHLYLQTFLKEDFNELDSILPSIIAIDFVNGLGPQKENEASEDTLNARRKVELQWLESLIQKIKKMENYTPIIFLFRSHLPNNKALQETYAYPMMMTHDHSIKIDILINLVHTYEKKKQEKRADIIERKIQELKEQSPLKYKDLNQENFVEQKYRIEKDSPLSFCHTKNSIVINSLTESEITFLSEVELPKKTFRMDFPFPMSIRPIPTEDGRPYIAKDKSKLYRALIHSISENDKKHLRRYVNDIFFETLNQKREQEEKDYWERHNELLENRHIRPPPEVINPKKLKNFS